jgi:hypothetical protein
MCFNIYKCASTGEKATIGKCAYTDEKFVYTDVESAVRKSVFWLCKNNGVDIYNNQKGVVRTKFDIYVFISWL